MAEHPKNTRTKLNDATAARKSTTRFGGPRAQPTTTGPQPTFTLESIRDPSGKLHQKGLVDEILETLFGTREEQAMGFGPAVGGFNVPRSALMKLFNVGGKKSIPLRAELQLLTGVNSPLSRDALRESLRRDTTRKSTVPVGGNTVERIMSVMDEAGLGRAFTRSQQSNMQRVSDLSTLHDSLGETMFIKHLQQRFGLSPAKAKVINRVFSKDPGLRELNEPDDLLFLAAQLSKLGKNLLE